MTITMNIWVMIISFIVVWLIGFFVGRISLHQGDWKEESEKKSERDIHKHNGAVILASPALGQLCYANLEQRSGVCIKPENGMVYAPTSGKIIKFFTNGNEFILRTDLGP